MQRMDKNITDFPGEEGVLALISRLYDQLIELFRLLSGVVVFSIFLLIVSDVLLRIFSLPLWTYSSGVVEYGLLWFTMLAAPWLVRIKGHVFIDAVTQMLPGGLQKIIAKIVYLICITSSAVFAWFSLQLLVEAFVSGQYDTRGEDFLLWTLLLPIPVGFSLVAIEFCRFLFGIDDMYTAADKEGV
jgi:C4-dicarboxylate transporter DctQ subunit